MARRAAELQKRQGEGKAVLYVDGGNLLYGTAYLEGNPQADLLRERARLVARVAAKMGAAAVNVGRQDLLDGLSAAERLGKDPGVPWVSANLRRKGGGFPFPRWRSGKWGGIQVGIFGLVSPEADQDARLGVEVIDPETAAREAVKALKGADVILCLSSLGLAEESRLAEAVPGLTAIVGGGSAEFLAVPQVVGSTLILHLGEKGKHLGVLDLPSKAVGKSWSAPRDVQERSVLEARLAGARAEIAGLGGGSEAELLARAGSDAQRLGQTQTALRTLSDLQRAKTELDKARAVYAHRVVTLDPSLREDPEVASWVRGYKSAEQDWYRKAGPRPVVPVPVAPAAAPAPPRPKGAPSPTGSAACRSCHPEAYRSWLGTAHSRAYLALRGKESEGSCLECHGSTLQRVEGPQLEPDVACETCHGPGGNHRAKGNIARKPPEKLCRQCHRGFHEGKTFAYEGAYGKVRCDRK